MAETRMILDEDDFAALVSGKVVEDKEKGVKIILSDIGFDRMLHLIHDAMSIEDVFPPPDLEPGSDSDF